MAEQSSNNRGALIGIIIALLLLLVGSIVYIFTLRTEVGGNATVVAEKDASIASVTKELDSLKTQLNLRIEEVKKLEGDTSVLVEMRRQLEQDLASAKAEARRARRELAEVESSGPSGGGDAPATSSEGGDAPASSASSGGGSGARRGKSTPKLRELQARVAEYINQLKQRDEEIAKLKAERDALFADNSKLKADMTAASDSLNKSNEARKELNTKVALASVLRVDDIFISMIDKSGVERDDDTFKAKKIDKIKFNIMLANNKVAKVENKEMVIRVIDETGATISDPAGGGGTFAFDGKEIPYTVKQTFLFENKDVPINLLWTPTKMLIKGLHSVEIYCEGYKIGEGEFFVK